MDRAQPAEAPRTQSRWWQPRPLPRWAFRLSLPLYLLVRVYLGMQPGAVWDTEGYAKGWALTAAIYGVSQTYEMSNYDYPPLYLYLVQPIGKLYLALHPELLTGQVVRLPWDELVFRLPGGQTYRSKWLLWNKYPGRQFEADPLPDYALFTFLIKAPALVFDLILAAILYWLIAYRATWGPSRTGEGWGRLAAAAYLWNPVVLWYSAYSGQADSIHSALILGSLALLGTGRLTSSAAALSTAGMMKPLAAPLVPLLAIVAGARQGVRGLLVAGTAGLAAALLIFAPFLFAGKGSAVIQRVLGDVEVMPFTSVNAHNLWWLFGGWQNANAPLLAGATPKAVGVTLFLLAYLALVLRNRSWLSGKGQEVSLYTAKLLLLGAAIMASFFYFSTHMHENHLYLTLVLLLAVAGRSRPLVSVTLAVSLVCAINGVLHDRVAPYLFPLINSPSPVGNPQYPGLAYTWVQLIGSYANTIGVSATIAWILGLTWRMSRTVPDSPPGSAAE